MPHQNNRLPALEKCLNHAIQESKLGIRDLGKKIGVSENTIRNWLMGRSSPHSYQLPLLCRELNITADELLGVKSIEHRLVTEREDYGIKWTAALPAWIPKPQEDDIKRGVEVFEIFVRDNRPARHAFEELTRRAVTPYMASCYLQAAFRSGALTLTHVANDDHLARQVKDRYRLSKVLVARIKEPFFDGTMIRAEIVAHLAAIQGVAAVPHGDVIAFGSGHTILRMAEQTIPGFWQFNRTEWLPLMATKNDRIPHHTANAIAVTMAQRHPGSIALFVPYSNEQTIPEWLRLKYNATTSAFLTVSHRGRNTSREGVAAQELVYRSHPQDESFEAASIQNMYNVIRDARVRDDFGGEILGLMLNHEGQIIPQIEARNREFVYPSDIGLLRKIRTNGFVWIVAARGYKVETVRLAISTGLANALVIDTEIAQLLLED